MGTSNIYMSSVLNMKGSDFCHGVGEGIVYFTNNSDEGYGACQLFAACGCHDCVFPLNFST